jgi:hypothetical protein
MISPQERQLSNLEHARWKVAFRQSIYDAHRTLANSGDEWMRKEQEFLQWLKKAKAELYRLEHPRSSSLPLQFHPATSPDSAGSRTSDSPDSHGTSPVSSRP